MYYLKEWGVYVQKVVGVGGGGGWGLFLLFKGVYVLPEVVGGVCTESGGGGGLLFIFKKTR